MTPKSALTKAAALACLALALACTDNATTTTVVGISGASNLAFVDDLVFVTATDSNELRVLDLNVGGTGKANWVPAPNPLSPLSIPVADRPIELARDVKWVADETNNNNVTDRGGSYVFSRSANSREISVVGATRDSLRQIAVVRSFNEEITAIAGRSNTADGTATLYVATYDGTFARIRTAAIPALGVKRSAYPVTVSDTALVEEPCAAILSVLVLPDPNQLAYSLRRTPAVEQKCSSGATPEERAASAAKLRAETSILIDTAANSRTVLEFGRTIRKLFTNAQYDVNRPAANRIYGIIDETSCGEGQSCRGVVAVEGPNFAGGVPDTDTPKNATAFPCGQAVGKIACDPSGFPMAPIQVGDTLIMDAAVGSANPTMPPYATPFPTRLTGILARSDGLLQLWDAENLIDFDVASGVAGTAGVFATDASGTVVPFDGSSGVRTGGDHPIPLANGAARDEVIRVELGAPLPGFVGLSAPAGTATILPSTSPLGEVEAGDQVVLSGADPACTGTFAVASVDATAITLKTALPNAADCALTVQPSLGESGPVSPRPWVVFGTTTGFLGRFAIPATPTVARVAMPEDPARRNALFYSHAGPNKTLEDQSVAQSFEFDAANPTPLVTFDFSDPFAGQPLPPQRGFRYVIQTIADFVREAPAVDGTQAINLGLSESPRVAGSLIFRPGTTQIVVSYPSNNVLLQINTSSITTGSDLTAFVPFN